jgi:hypothetical protein
MESLNRKKRKYGVVSTGFFSLCLGNAWPRNPSGLGKAEGFENSKAGEILAFLDWLRQTQTAPDLARTVLFFRIIF